MNQRFPLWVKTLEEPQTSICIKEKGEEALYGLGKVDQWYSAKMQLSR